MPADGAGLGASGLLEGGAAESLVALLEARASECAAERGYVFLLDGEQSEQRLSYRALCERARALGAVLASRCPPGERALILLPPGIEFISAFFACMYAGLVAVPVPLPRKRGLPRLLAVIADCRPRLALSTRELLDKTSAAAQLPLVDWLAVDDAPAAVAPLHHPAHADAAFLQYTSGSTGTPKGVVLTHGNLLANERMIARAFEHGPDSVIVGWLPPHHDMGLIGNILQPLYLGASCIQMSPQHFLLRPARWLEAISRYRGTTSGGPNFAYDLCVDKIPARERAALDLSSWRVAFNGAEPVRAGTLERFACAFADSGFRRSAFYPCYGLAEASLLVTGGSVAAEPVVLPFDRDALGSGVGQLAPADGAASIVLTAAGKPAEGLQVEIVEPESGRVLGQGEVGEVWVRGPSVAAGYWQAADATRQVFGAYTSEDQGPFLRTGDLAFRRGDELFIAGRSKDVIVVRGRNVHPQDLELSAESSHALLRSGGACAFGLESGAAELVVLVLEVPDGAEGLPALASAVRQAIAEQHEVSLHAIVLVRTGALPRTTSGKLQRRSCREQLLASALPVVWDSRVAELEGSTPADATEPFAEPLRGELEQRVAELWCEVLGLGRIGRNEPFLERGGDSLRALQLTARIEEQLGVPLPAALLFESCTVASLAQWLESRGARAAGVPARAHQGGALEPAAAFPLSATQERMWFLDQLAEGAAIHHLALALELRGELRREPLQRAIARLVARHAALRTRFVMVDGRPFQRVEAPVDGAGPRTLSELSATSEPVLEATLRDAVCRPFQPEEAPPVRWLLAQRAPREHVLVLACHHLLADGWSLNLLLRELCVIYAAELDSIAPVLSSVAATYADYVAWQMQPERAARQEHARTFWLERLRGLEGGELPTDRPRPAIQSYAGGRLELLLEPALLQRLEAAGRSAGGTLFSTLATALFALLYRATGHTDLCLGTPLFDRGRRAFEQLVGCCVNTLALRVEVTGELALAELAARVQAAVREGLEHGELPFERVLAALPSRRDPSRSPLFQVMLTVQPELGSLPPVPGLTLAARQLGTDTAQFDLAIDVARDGRAARVAWEYNRELFDADTMHAYWARFCRLLEALCADPGQRVSAVELRDAGERERTQHALTARQRAAVERVGAQGVLQRVAHWVAAQPEALALVQGQQSWSFAELGRRAEQLAQRLRRAGVGAEARVALYLPSSPRMVAAALGVLQAGGAYVPLELQQPASRLEQVLAEADAHWIVSESALVAGLPASSAQLILLDEPTPGGAELAPLPEAQPEQLAYVLFTSGSTGKPKGVLVSHGMLRDTCRGWDELYGWGERPPRVLGVSNPAFDVWSADWLRALCSGGCLVFAGAEVLLDPPALSQLIAAQRIDLVDLVPSVLRPLLVHWQSPGGAVPQQVRVFIVGSEAWSRSEYRALRGVLPASTRLLSCYGVTEATIDSAWFEAAEAMAPAGEGSVPLGVPLPGSQLYVLDRDGTELPAGMAGELAIGGSGVARGYAGRARWTAERFRPDPFSAEPGARLYLSGDRVRRARDGNLEFLGRRDQQLKLRGRRVEPAEIERQLLAHPAIAACAVSLWSRGGGEPLLVAYLVPSAQPIASAELRAQLRAHLPETLLPSRVVWLEALPLNANGKLDRARLPEPVAEPTSSPAAAGELEQRIAAIWQEALGLQHVGRHDNFFDLGGHSLLLTRVLGRLRAEVRADLAMVTLFRHPTVAALAEALGAGERAAVAAAPAASEPRAADRRRELRARRRGLEQDE